MQTQAKDYQEGRIRQIQSRIGEAQAAQESAAAKLREADSALKRTISLNDRGLQTNITLDKAKADYDVAQQDIQGAQQRYNFLTTELAAAKNGVFIGDSYNDAPSSTQRIREFDLRLAELNAESQQAEMRLKLSTEQIAAERLRVNKLTAADLNTENPSIVWNFLVSGGEYVNRGQDLMRLVDCSTTMVTASVSESVYARLKVGMPAQFRLNADKRVFDATITRLGGSGASGLYATLAIGPSTEHLTRFDVALDVPGLLEDQELACAVGRTGRVLFTGGPLSGVRETLARFGF
ncbi:HlyD family efflux transporter periplasmic adaptor subunit [Microvirga rosea]|uniref:HlyD family efflux transporter periplasmic adaptor subunit n=1 Tax=Microvirga rosea TaxID=2715425 RepID=UPI001D0A2E0A|nr:HlyD family efflux transporter periplasmic adaptor subunit [Microvirga rosea]MCB8822173.1 HlyD family efflux transporter periplasmic adaptor subunit [Microvirga rosea]